MQPGAGGEQLAQDLKLVESPFGGGVEAGADGGEVASQACMAGRWA